MKQHIKDPNLLKNNNCFNHKLVWQLQMKLSKFIQ